LDFHDLEQFCAELLGILKPEKPTEFAERWRSKIALRFRGRISDINAAPGKIMSAFPAMAQMRTLSCRRREAEHLSFSAGGSENFPRLR